MPSDEPFQDSVRDAMRDLMRRIREEGTGRVAPAEPNQLAEGTRLDAARPESSDPSTGAPTGSPWANLASHDASSDAAIAGNGAPGGIGAAPPTV